MSDNSAGQPRSSAVLNGVLKDLKRIREALQADQTTAAVIPGDAVVRTLDSCYRSICMIFPSKERSDQ